MELTLLQFWSLKVAHIAWEERNSLNIQNSLFYGGTLLTDGACSRCNSVTLPIVHSLLKPQESESIISDQPRFCHLCASFQVKDGTPSCTHPPGCWWRILCAEHVIKKQPPHLRDVFDTHPRFQSVWTWLSDRICAAIPSVSTQHTAESSNLPAVWVHTISIQLRPRLNFPHWASWTVWCPTLGNNTCADRTKTTHDWKHKIHILKSKLWVVYFCMSCAKSSPVWNPENLFNFTPEKKESRIAVAHIERPNRWTRQAAANACDNFHDIPDGFFTLHQHSWWLRCLYLTMARPERRGLELELKLRTMTQRNSRSSVTMTEASSRSWMSSTRGTRASAPAPQGWRTHSQPGASSRAPEMPATSRGDSVRSLDCTSTASVLTADVSVVGHLCCQRFQIGTLFVLHRSDGNQTSPTGLEEHWAFSGKGNASYRSFSLEPWSFLLEQELVNLPRTSEKNQWYTKHSTTNEPTSPTLRASIQRSGLDALWTLHDNYKRTICLWRGWPGYLETARVCTVTNAARDRRDAVLKRNSWNRQKRSSKPDWYKGTFGRRWGGGLFRVLGCTTNGQSLIPGEDSVHSGLLSTLKPNSVHGYEFCLSGSSACIPDCSHKNFLTDILTFFWLSLDLSVESEVRRHYISGDATVKDFIRGRKDWVLRKLTVLRVSERYQVRTQFLLHLK